MSAAVRQYITHKPMLWVATQTKSVQRARVLEGKLRAPYLYFHTLGPEHKPSSVACFHVSHVTAVHDLTAQQIPPPPHLEHVYSLREILELRSG